MGPFEEVGDVGGVDMEETLLANWDAVPAPVDLNEFG